jgi:hypothetical protein
MGVSLVCLHQSLIAFPFLVKALSFMGSINRNFGLGFHIQLST